MKKNKSTIPSDWTIEPLINVCDVLIGGTPARKNEVFWDIEKETENIWVSIADLSALSGRYISDSSEYISDLGAQKSNVKKIPKGTVIMSFKLSIGKMAITAKPLYTNEAIAGFIPRGDIVPEFLFYSLPQLGYEMDTAVKGKTLNKEKIQNAKITLPPKPEQQKIAEILGAVDEDIEKTEEVIRETEKLKRGMMKNLLTKGIGHTKFKKTKLGEVPEGWEIKKVGEICETTSGGTPRKDNLKFYENGTIPWLTSGEIKEGLITKSNQFITEDALKKSSAKLMPIDTVMIAMYGVTAGQVGILKFKATTNQAVCGILPNKKFVPDFVYHFFKQKTAELKALGGGGAQPNISQTIIRDQYILIPSLEEQKQIAGILSIIDEKITINKQLKEKLITLKKGLMSDLLSGKVRTI